MNLNPWRKKIKSRHKKEFKGKGEIKKWKGMGEEEGKERREQEVEFDVGGEGGSDERNINVKPWNREMQVSEL